MLVTKSSFKLTTGVILCLLCITSFILFYALVDYELEWLYAKVIYLIYSTLYIAKKGLNNNIIPFSVPILIAEIIILKLSVYFFKKNRFSRSKDRLDTLLDESKEILQKTNEYLEKWRLRRETADYSYMDERLDQDLKPTRTEVPILHMAIIDTIGTTRRSPERGDAGDTINIKDTTLLSFTSLLEEDFDAISDKSVGEENVTEEISNSDLKFTVGWDVTDD